MTATTILVGAAVIVAIPCVTWLAANNLPVPDVLTYVLTGGIGALGGHLATKRQQ